MNQTVKISEGALYCGIVFIFLMVNRWMGNSLEFMFYWFLSFPIILYGAKYGFRNNLVLCSAMMIMAMIFTSLTTWFYLFSAQIVGLFYGHGVRKKWSNKILIIISIIFTLFAYLITTVLFASFFGYSISEDIMFANMILELTNIQVVDFDGFVLKIVLLIALLSSILQGLSVHMVSNLLLKRLKIEVHPMKNPVLFETSKKTGLIIIGVILLYFLGNMMNVTGNIDHILMVFALLAFLSALYYGIMIVWYHAIIKRKRWLMILVVVIAFIPYLNYIIAGYGIFNQFIDTRKRGYIR